MIEKCEKCSKPIEKNGFCSWHGQIFDMWLCDDCVHELRSRGVNLGVTRPALTLDQVENSLGTLELAIKNMGMIDVVAGRDGAMANRNIDAFLDFRESKTVYELLIIILKAKLDAAKDVAAENAKALLKKLNK